MQSSQNVEEPASISRADFILNLNQSGLIANDATARDITSLIDSDTNADGNLLARSLMEAGALTDFQAKAICDGKFDELTIGGYEVLEKLGAGGMGTVYKARHRRMKRIVALKVLARSLASNTAFVQRFQREVETIARLTHPNIVMAYDADEAKVGLYLVMEFVDGQDLNNLVEKTGPFAVADAVDCILQTARGLDYAHAQGIIHRDIKPANLLRDAAGVVKVTDLGLARFSALAGDQGVGDANSITQAGSVLGTANFMPPEQAVDSTDIDHRADIYSLGGTLYFLLMGKPPFEGQTIVATLLKHREAPIPTLSQDRADVPAELDEILRRMMAKKPTDRYQSMAEVVHALEGVQSRIGKIVAAAPPAKPVPAFGASSCEATGVWENDPESPSRLPLDAPTTPIDSDIAKSASVPGRPQRVLLVEPSRTQAGIIRRYLQAQGHEVVGSVATGKEALEFARTALPDAIVGAMYLSDMTGVQLAQQILDECNAVTPGFVLISSETEGSNANSISNCGHAVVLKKPFTPEQLVVALKLVSAASTKSQPLPRKLRGELCVLLVDDSAAARRHVRDVLGGLGISSIIEAVDGARAVAALAGAKFDLIVTDYNMPFMDGRGLIGYLKQNPATASIPIILVTTEEEPEKLNEVRRLGVTAVCDKSFPIAVVQKVVDEIEKQP